jgi:hypothetical protein
MWSPHFFSPPQPKTSAPLRFSSLPQQSPRCNIGPASGPVSLSLWARWVAITQAAASQHRDRLRGGLAWGGSGRPVGCNACVWYFPRKPIGAFLAPPPSRAGDGPGWEVMGGMRHQMVIPFPFFSLAFSLPHPHPAVAVWREHSPRNHSGCLCKLFAAKVCTLGTFAV